MIKHALLSLVALAAMPACTTAQPGEEDVTPAATSIGAVTAADPRAEEAGMEMLRRGGSATDAAIAVMLALTVVEPQSSGIGGGGFYVRASADGNVQTLDGRETAPKGATPDWFLNEDGSTPPFRESVLSGLSVGVPGNIALAAKAHEQHGTLEWAELFEPAIALARGGYKINNRLFGYLERMPERVGKSPAGRALFYDAVGEPLPAGTLVKNEKLAQTLELLANQGPSAFYNGALAGEIAEAVAADTPREGAMTTYDIGSYASLERMPVCGSYRGYKICGMGPPSSGGVAVLQILGQLERFDLAELGLQNPVTWHLFLESQRLAYADRELYMADADFVNVPWSGLVTPPYLAERSALISENARATEVRAGSPVGAPQDRADGDEPPEQGTSHFSVATADGTLISYTSTIEGPFGSGLMAGGFYLNNELTDFSRRPERDGKLVANRVEGGKRPRSSMAPTVVFDPSGKPVLAIGAAGGGTIPVQTARGIIGVIDFGLSAEEAIALPFIMGFGDRVLIEKGTWLEDAQDAFKALGHEQLMVREAPLKAGAILRTDDGWDAARDPRIETGLIVP